MAEKRTTRSVVGFMGGGKYTVCRVDDAGPYKGILEIRLELPKIGYDRAITHVLETDDPAYEARAIAECFMMLAQEALDK